MSIVLSGANIIKQNHSNLQSFHGNYWGNIALQLYDNKYASIIDNTSMNSFNPFKHLALALQNIWDTLSDILESVYAFL